MQETKEEEADEHDDHNGATRTVEITKTVDALGMTICKTTNSLVFIASILSGGPAAQQGGLRSGDQIVRVSMVLAGKCRVGP